jgi:undecaprenyl-diphosphatase
MSNGPAPVISDRALLQGGLVCLALFLLLTLIVTHELFDGTDRAARALVHRIQGPQLSSFMAGASYLGGSAGQVAVVIVGSVMLWPRRRRWAVALPLVMAGGGIVKLVAKWGIDHPRPNLTAWGFPSAHVLSLVVLCGYLAYVVGSGTDVRRRRWPAVAASVVIVAVVGYSRMYLDMHFLSDLLGGFAAGLAYLLAAIWAIRSAPRLARSLTLVPVAAESETILAPAHALSSADPLVVAAAAVSLTPATPVGDAS